MTPSAHPTPVGTEPPAPSQPPLVAPSAAARLAALLQLDLLDGHEHGARPPLGARLVAGAGRDDTGHRGVTRARLRSVDGRVAVLGVGVAIAYGPQLARLPNALGIDSPLAYAALAPVLALFVAVGTIRTAPAGPPRLPLRESDRICGGAFVALAVLVALVGPRLFGFDTGPWRVGLASLPFFLVGSVWLLFGGRAVWWLRYSFVAAALVAPVWYVWAVTFAQGTSTAATWRVVQMGSGLVGVRAATVGGTGMLEVGDQFVAVSAACSGASAVLGWLIVALSLTPVLTGRPRAKLAWVLTGAAAAWVGNCLRIGVLVAVGRAVSADVALRWVHPWAGLVLVGVVTTVMLALVPRFGLARRPIVVTEARRRLAAVTPNRWLGGGAVVVALAVTLAATGVGGWRYEALGGRNGRTNRTVVEALAPTDGVVPVEGQAWPMVAFGPVVWAPQFFGEGADWRRFAVFPGATGSGTTPGTAEDDGTERPAWAVDIDATTATSLERFDAYSLEACYGFHGFRVDRKELSSTLPDRPAEQIDYRDLPTRVGTFVLSWRQKVAGGRIERVVLSAPYAAGEVTAENAGLPDRATAAAAVTALGRTLAQAVSL